MDASNIKDFDFTEIVNRHSDNVRHETVSQVYEKAINNSINKEEIRYWEKKEKVRDKINRCIASIAILATLITGAVVVIDRGKDGRGNNEVSIAQQINDQIDDKINNYYEMMKYTGDADTRIEQAYSYNGKTKEANVDYLPGNFLKHIVTASDVDEIEVRSALLAAYKVINEPYRDEQFNKVLSSLSNEKEFSDISSRYIFLNVDDTQDFLESLGYKDWEDYQLHERANIKQLNQINENLNGISRR